MLRPLSLPFLAVLATTASATTASATEAMTLRPPVPIQEEVARSLDASDLGGEIDRSLRWLRSQQKEDGGYGSVGETAQVLLAFAASPRAYRTDDGPFIARALERLVAAQAADGAIADAGVAQELRRAQTVSALRALELVGGREDARAKAASFLGLSGPRSEANASAKEGMPADALLDRAAELLLVRRSDGSWKGGVGESATNVLELSEIARALKRHAPSSAAPADVQPLPELASGEREAARKALLRGSSYLANQAQEGRFLFDGTPDAGISAMAVGALCAVEREERGATQHVIDSVLGWLVSLQRPDGSIHDGQLANYVTSAAVLALCAENLPRYEPIVERARGFLLALQADGGEGYGRTDRYYGGVGYGGDERPDLSNLQMALEALAASGVPSDDATFQNAIVFLQRCQNRSESNDLTVADGNTTITSGDDGGAGYAPGTSKAGFVELADGRRVPRSYGSMTYALLKSYLLAGLERDDPRVEAAFRWISQNYTLDLNPGFEATDDPSAAYQGLYYYFLAMARALDLHGAEEIVDATGASHRWREELVGRIVAMQRADGSWLNANSSRWFEGNPVLATSYAMLTLEACLGNAEARPVPAKSERRER